jgi:hypothetical protein
MTGRCKVIRVKPIRAPSITCTCILKYLAKAFGGQHSDATCSRKVCGAVTQEKYLCFKCISSLLLNSPVCSAPQLVQVSIFKYLLKYLITYVSHILSCEWGANDAEPVHKPVRYRLDNGIRSCTGILVEVNCRPPGHCFRLWREESAERDSYQPPEGGEFRIQGSCEVAIW